MEGIRYFIERTDTHKWLELNLHEALKPLPNNSGNTWTDNPNDAVMFDTFEEAEKYRLKYGYHFDNFIVTEHEFVKRLSK